MIARSTQGPADAGFTLVEMLVALTIFALLSAAGVGILRASVDTQSAVEDRLTQVSAVARLHAVLASDLGQAVARPARGPSGGTPDFLGEPGSMQWVRAGWSNPDGDARSTLQRVEWRLDAKGLARIGHRALDGGDQAGSGQPAVVVRDLEQIAFRYRSSTGDWTAAWQSTPQEPLPAAVELMMRPTGQAPLVMVIALPPRGSEHPPQPPAPAPSSVPA